MLACCMLVNQSLDPLVSAYFKDVAQTKTLIQLIQERSEIRERAVGEMKDKFAKYNIELEEVLIGTPRSQTGDIQIENILTQLRERQIAEEKKVTYQKQQSAAESEKSLREAEAVAVQQTALTNSKIQIEVEANNGAALARKAEQEAGQIIALAKANAQRVTMEGEAQGSKESSVGLARAKAIDAQVKAYGGAEYRLIQDVVEKLSDAIKTTNIDIVPKTVVNMGGDSDGGSTIMDALLKLVTIDKLGVNLQNIKNHESPVEVEEIVPVEIKVEEMPHKKTKAEKSASEETKAEPVAKTE